MRRAQVDGIAILFGHVAIVTQVTKISQDIVIDDVRNHFGQYGVMGDFYMPSPPHNKERHKGIAFITSASSGTESLRT